MEVSAGLHQIYPNIQQEIVNIMPFDGANKMT